MSITAITFHQQLRLQPIVVILVKVNLAWVFSIGVFAVIVFLNHRVSIGQLWRAEVFLFLAIVRCLLNGQVHQRNLVFVLWHGQLKTKVYFQLVLLLDFSFVLDCWVEKAIFRKVSENLTLRIVRRKDNQSLFIGIEIDPDLHISFKQTVVDD